METFLNDYGLVWIGGKDSSIDSTPPKEAAAAPAGDSDGPSKEDEAESKGGEPASTAPAFTFNMHKFKERLEQLNGVAGEGQAKVVAKVSVHNEQAACTSPLTSCALPPARCASVADAGG